MKRLWNIYVSFKILAIIASVSQCVEMRQAVVAYISRAKWKLIRGVLFYGL